MSKHQSFDEHIMSHTKDNTYWENDIKGIPLCRVCDKCRGTRLMAYSPSVLSEEQQIAAFHRVIVPEGKEAYCPDERVEADD